MPGLHGVLACRDPDGLYYGSVEPAPDLSSWTARRGLSAPWLAKIRASGHGDARRFPTLEAAAAWLRDVPAPKRPADVLPGAEILDGAAVILPVGAAGDLRIAHLLLHPSTHILRSAPHAIAVPHLSPEERPGILLDGNLARAIWHTPRGQRRVRPRTKIGLPTAGSGWLWHDTIWQDAGEELRLPDLLARIALDLPLHGDAPTAHQRAQAAQDAEAIRAMLRQTPWPEAAQHLLPIEPAPIFS